MSDCEVVEENGRKIRCQFLFSTAKREKQASPKRLHRHTSRSSTSDHVHTSEASDTTDDQRSTTRSSVAVEINLTRVKKRKLSPWHLHRSPLDTCYDSQPNVPSVPLLSLRTSIQKGKFPLIKLNLSRVSYFSSPRRTRSNYYQQITRALDYWTILPAIQAKESMVL